MLAVVFSLIFDEACNTVILSEIAHLICNLSHGLQEQAYIPTVPRTGSQPVVICQSSTTAELISAEAGMGLGQGAWNHWENDMASWLFYRLHDAVPSMLASRFALA